jgi:MFS superfamily sulfate permease-like transporter
VLVYRLDDRLFFANAGYVKGRIREALHGAPTPVRWLVFDAEALSHVDATGVDALTSPVASLREDQITFVFARLKAPCARPSARPASWTWSAWGMSIPPSEPPSRPRRHPRRTLEARRRIDSGGAGGAACVNRGAAWSDNQA